MFSFMENILKLFFIPVIYYDKNYSKRKQSGPRRGYSTIRAAETYTFMVSNIWLYIMQGIFLIKQKIAESASG